jgi:DNA-binding response OmpR family regulator
MPRSKTPAVVLLVQPDDDNRTMYAEYFRHHGLKPVCPSDWTHALTLAPTADVIITAVQLTGQMGGFDFIQRLRHGVQTKDKPIIVLTGWAWQTERLRAEEAGCDLFLTKPCLPEEVLRHVRRSLRSAKVRHAVRKSVRRHRTGEAADHG